jgi:hypothetical protein
MDAQDKMDWINMVQDTDKCLIIVNTAMNMRVLEGGRIFFFFAQMKDYSLFKGDFAPWNYQNNHVLNKGCVSESGFYFFTLKSVVYDWFLRQ